jgi:hypothetical protein
LEFNKKKKENEIKFQKSAIIYFTNEYYLILNDLLKDNLITKELFKENTEELKIFEGFEYFIKKFDELKPSEYSPTIQDILNCKKPNDNINEIIYKEEVKIKGNDIFLQEIEIIDISIYKENKEKWIKIFNNTNVIGFIISLNEYDNPELFQNNFKLFELINIDIFKSLTIICFLNKIDLFQEKIKKKPLKNYFSEYNGGDDLDSNLKYIQNLFKNKVSYDQDRIYFLNCNANNQNLFKELYQNILKITNERHEKLYKK